jgi:PAS domain S-box-containing protein
VRTDPDHLIVKGTLYLIALNQPSTPKSKVPVVYAFALAAVIAATSMRLLPLPVIGQGVPYIFYVLPIIGAAAYGGFAPGLFATITSGLVLLLVFLGRRALVFPEGAYFLFFLLDGLCISWLGGRMRAAIREAGEAAEESERARDRERTILKSISDAFASLDENWRLSHVNEKFAALTGYSLKELPGKQAWQVLPELAQSPARRELERALREQTPVRVEVYIPRLGRWFETSAYPQHGGLSLFSRDITDRKHAEEMLREAEERLRLAPEAARIGTWTWDLSSHSIVWSPEMEYIFGLAPGSFAGTEEAFLAVVHPQERAKVQDVIVAAVERRGQYEVEFRYLHAGGDARWMLCRGKVCSDPFGLPVRIVGIGIDVSDQRRADEKLRHTQKLESLGVLAGGIAHDFNNLLVGIMGNAGLAAESPSVSEGVRNQLQEIILASEKAAHLTRQMLAYAGKGRFTVERLQMSTLIRDTERLLRSSVLKHVDLRLDLGGELPCVEADPGQMQQVIMNLVINGAEAIAEGEPGTVLVRTRLEYIDESFVKTQLSGQDIVPGHYVVLEVHDTGTGMDEATQARIFEPFFTTKFVGRGLGLAAVTGIVRSHKGAMKVSSSPGKGATFHVLLPAVSEPHKASAPRAEDTDPQGTGAVLIVDDESCVRNLAQAVLHKYGYTTLVAEDAFAAINILRRSRHPVGVVLLDLSMPGMSTAQAIRAIEANWPSVRILLSSGYDEEEVLSQFSGAQLVGFVQKPYLPAQLAMKIKAAMALPPRQADETATAISTVAA